MLLRDFVSIHCEPFVGVTLIDYYFCRDSLHGRPTLASLCCLWKNCCELDYRPLSLCFGTPTGGGAGYFTIAAVFSY